MKLLVDIGNTSAKLMVADGDEFVCFERLAETWKGTFLRLRERYPLERVNISTVAGRDDSLLAALSDIGLPVTWLSHETPCPVKPVPNVPMGYGADRWAADIGAMKQDSEHTLLVIDAGTCITYDLISREGTILGGAISPGVQLRLNSMHEHTALLPLIDAQLALGSLRETEGWAGGYCPSSGVPLLGKDTFAAMLSPAVNGARFEIEGYIRSLWQDYPDLHVFMTGGNTFTLSEDIGPVVTCDPYLLFRGLNALP